ncbi:ankyrin repeat domain-containing protein 26-like [Cyprinodon tularosa]|uniref:ankyrin repeat domain-containing protein 26-like n=1 Tax=Cyprinodon tularosa TaxID=77115 RepID=UPI0018E28275|nr:ankyrin repeat domain-containing protein 26-like [Cyprinodon tularosa]
MQKPEDIDTGDDLDELTESSDTSTDDMDSANSGYRHASLLMQRLSSSTFDSISTTQLQNILHRYDLNIEKLNSRHGYLEEKMCHLQMERETLKVSLEELKHEKSLLKRKQLELKTQITNPKFQLKQEQENHHANMMYNATRDKLRRLEEQQQMEVQVKQKVELDMRTLISNTKQLEEEHAETQRLLAQERSTRALQENLLNSHLPKQQEVENKRIISSSSSEALSQLTEASDRERELLQQTASLQEQLSMLRNDLERSQANGELKESHLLEENEMLKEQLENERQARETLEAEVESTRSRLARAVQEAELSLAAHSDSEKTLIREREEHQRIRDRLNGELASQREAVNSLSQKLDKAEARANSMKNEVYQVTLQLTEKGLLLDVLQREKEQAATRTKELENALHAEREQVSHAAARHEATQKRLAQAQSEAMLLRQQLEEAINKGSAKERAVTDAQERFTDILSKLRSDGEGRVQMVEDRNKELAAKAADLRDQIYKLEEEKNERETSMRQLQQELADSLKKLSMSEASLEFNTRYCNQLEEEKARLLKDNDRLRVKLDESEDQYVQAKRRINSLKSSLGDREKELSSAAQKLQEALSAAAAAELTVKQLEGAVQRLEIENAKELENALHAEREQVSHAAARHEATQKRLAQAQSEAMLLRQQLEEAINKGSAKERAVTDAQERFTDILSKLRSDGEGRVQMVEDRNKELAVKAADLRNQIYKLEEEKNERETSMRQLQQELADSLKKLSMSEASLEVNTRYCNQLEEEKARLLKDNDRLRVKLDESEDQYVQAKRRINSLKSSLGDREKELSSAAQKLQEALSAAAAAELTVKQLEGAVQRLEIENARLEAADTRLDLELKSRSKLSLRLAELEKEKGELTSQMEMEKKKAEKMAEQKKAADTRLDLEMKRNIELQKELYTFGWMKEKVDNLQGQLEKETSLRNQLEKINEELKDQVASLKGLVRSHDEQERSKRLLEEEVLELRRQLEANHIQREQYRREIEEKAQQDLKEKLEQVNLFLQSQAASQEQLDQLKAANEANLRTQLEQRIQKLEAELGRARSGQLESLNQRESELERYRQLYNEEMRQRKSLAAKLDRTNSRLSEAPSCSVQQVRPC